MSEYTFDIKFYFLLIPVLILDILALIASAPLVFIPWWFALSDGNIPFILRLYKGKKE